MRRKWQRELDNEAKNALAFRVTWAPVSTRLGVLILCAACAEAWPLRDAANRAQFDGDPVPMTEAEINALRIPCCGACGWVVLAYNPPRTRRPEEMDIPRRSLA